MSNEVATMNQTQIAMPADLAAMFGQVKSNVITAERVNQLRISGKVWKVELEGEVKKLTTIVEGEEIPVPMVKVIILNQNPKRARALFEGTYDESTASAPVCWSSDSVTPDAEVEHPKARSCAECAESTKHTKFDESNPDKVIEYVPCKFNKRVVVVQHNKPDSPAMRLQLAITSLWEPKETAKNKEVQGWYAFDSYTKMLAAKGIQHTAMCRTIMKFDSEANQPKVLFKFDGLIDAETAAKIVPRIESEEVQKCLGTKKHETPVPAEREQAPEVEQDVANIAAAIEAQKAAEAEAAKAKAAAEKKAKAAAEKKAKEEAEAAEKAKAASKVEVVEADSIEDALSVSWD